MRYHLTPIRMAITKKKKKSTNNTCWRGCGEKGTLLHHWWECKLVQLLRRPVWRFLIKLEIPGVGTGNLLQNSCLENATDRGAWRATVHRVTESWTQPSTHRQRIQLFPNGVKVVPDKLTQLFTESKKDCIFSFEWWFSILIGKGPKCRIWP